MFRRIIPTTEAAKLRQVQQPHEHGGQKFPAIVALGGCYMKAENYGPKTLLTEAAPCCWSPITPQK